MSEQEIIEGNKLIAEFMGYKLITPEMRRNPEDWYINGKPSCYWENHLLRGSKKVLCSENSLRYHSSWDWLMPVIDKIHDIDEGLVTDRNYHIEILKRYVRVIYNWNNYIIPTIDTTNQAAYSESFEDYRYIFFDSKIEAVWFAVVKFIKWYNSCQKEK